MSAGVKQSPHTRRIVSDHGMLQSYVGGQHSKTRQSLLETGTMNLQKEEIKGLEKSKNFHKRSNPTNGPKVGF